MLSNIRRISILNLYHLIIIIIICLGQIGNSHAYSTETGIQDGDIIEVVAYGVIRNGTRDGEVFQEASSFQTEVSPSTLILGFYEVLLGLKVGQAIYNVIIPPEKGYTQIGHDLFNQTLEFDIEIISLIHNNNVNNPVLETNEESTSRIFSSLIEYVKYLLVIVLSLFVFLIIRTKFVSLVKPDCTFCNGKGEGTCSKCGVISCRISFATGCLNCKNNGFISFNKREERR